MIDLADLTDPHPDQPLQAVNSVAVTFDGERYCVRLLHNPAAPEVLGKFALSPQAMLNALAAFVAMSRQAVEQGLVSPESLQKALAAKQAPGTTTLLRGFPFETNMTAARPR